MRLKRSPEGKNHVRQNKMRKTEAGKNNVRKNKKTASKIRDTLACLVRCFHNKTDKVNIVSISFQTTS